MSYFPPDEPVGGGTTGAHELAFLGYVTSTPVTHGHFELNRCYFSLQLYVREVYGYFGHFLIWLGTHSLICDLDIW